MQFKKILAAVALVGATYFGANAQTCGNGPLSVTIDGSTTGTALAFVGTPTKSNFGGFNTSCKVNAANEDIVTSQVYNGTIAITISGGTAPYDYWICDATAGACTPTGILSITPTTTPTTGLTSGADNDPALTFTYMNLDEGTYTLLVRDANGCSITQTVTLDAPPLLQAGVAQTTQDLCMQCTGSMTVTACGGVPAYDVAWSVGTVPPAGTWTSTGGTAIAPATSGLLPANSADNNLISTSGGTTVFTTACGTVPYNFTITDANGCQID